MASERNMPIKQLTARLLTYAMDNISEVDVYDAEAIDLPMRRLCSIITPEFAADLRNMCGEMNRARAKLRVIEETLSLPDDHIDECLISKNKPQHKSSSGNDAGDNGPVQPTDNDRESTSAST
jgi:hypothetical protein